MTPKNQADIARKIEELNDLTVNQLQKKWEETWNEPCRSRNKDFLRKRIAWRIQALASGGLSQRALERARELADETLLRVRPPRQVPGPSPESETETSAFVPTSSEPSRPMPGAILTREYRGRKLVVSVLEDGFEFEGAVYKSLSAVAKAATGAHWNGWLFFGLRKPAKEAA